MRHIVVIVGSENDLPQCLKGLKWLRLLRAQCHVRITVHVKSVHRHTSSLTWLLDKLSSERRSEDETVIIAGAGMAAALPGFVDAYLRYHLGDTKISVIGVAFCGKGLLGIIDTIAAWLSIIQTPKTQVRFAGIGKWGFLKAARLAYNGSLPEIKLAEIPSAQELGLEQAIELAEMQK